MTWGFQDFPSEGGRITECSKAQALELDNLCPPLPGILELTLAHYLLSSFQFLHLESEDDHCTCVIVMRNKLENECKRQSTIPGIE